MRIGLVLIINLFLVFICFACKPIANESKPMKNNALESRLVLAQWSFNRELFKEKMNTFDFVRIAKEMGFVGVEYVNQFFMDKIEDDVYLDSLRNTANKLGIKNTLLMIDRAGNLGASNKEERELAVAEHKRWILAAKRLGCPNIRVNAHGDGSSSEVMAACKGSISELGKWGKQHGVGILIENHGSYSSDGDWLLALVESLSSDGISSIADFDNWCMERENGALWGAPCIKEYDRYLGVKQLLPSAKSVSIKAFDFDENGMPIKTDFKRMFELIRQSGYDGYLAVEFEGEDIEARVGVMRIKALAERFVLEGE